MIIYIVKQGDTIESIAKQFGVSVTRLIQDNGLDVTGNLVIGQTIVILYPTRTYTVKEGDTLSSIASEQGITVIQLLRNNPFLSDRKYIYPGEILVIQYDHSRGSIITNGYANSFIDRDVLRNTLPYLTYLSVFGYRTVENAEIIQIEEEDIIQLAKEYHVVPIMLLSTVTVQGVPNTEASYRLLFSDELINKHIDNILIILQSKGYYGVNVTFQFINEENRHLYENYTRKLATRLKKEGYIVFVTISEDFVFESGQIKYTKVNYSTITQLVDGITILNYNFGYSYGPPGPVTSVYLLRQFLDNVIQSVPAEKIELGIPNIGYDWELPYIVGITRANSLTLDSAITLAGDMGVPIQFDEESRTPYYRYIDNRSGLPRHHIVWFMDARSVEALMNLTTEYGLRGNGIWNIMSYFHQLWLIINGQYKIETLI